MGVSEYIRYKALNGNSGGGGGGTLADEVYPFGANVTLNVSGVPSGQWIPLSTLDDRSVAVAEYDSEYNEYTILDELSAMSKEYDFKVLSTQTEALIGIDYPNLWTITTEGAAEYDAEFECVSITGDCTINAEYIGS